MWTQLELFDKQTEMEYAMSLTSDELQSIKQSNRYSYELLKNLRHIAQRCESMKKGADLRAGMEIQKLLSGVYDFTRGYSR